MTAYERLVDALRDHRSDVKDNGQGKAMAQCTAHDDGKRSLSIGPRKDGKGVVVYCHAGCDLTAVLTALGLSERDLFDDNEIRAAYRTRADYKYPDGRVVHRKPDKSFPQSGNTKGNALFRADKVAVADVVHVVEGEKDVLAIQAVGGTAVCSAMGAGKARLADWSPLGGKNVVIIADRDEPGRKHAAQVADLLRPIAKAVAVVEAATGKDAADHIAAGKTLDELVPAEAQGPIDGAQVLDDVEHFAGRFLAFPTKHHLVVICLWIAHTWSVTAFYVTPRLVLDSPEPGSGKTRVLEVLALLCPNAKLTISTTTAALYRRIAKASTEDPAAENGQLVLVELIPTILQDEADAIFGRTNNPQAEDLRALYNSGYKRGATVDRCEGDAKNMVVREFPVFAPVALAGLAGKMPQTILDRAVVLHMRRRAPDEHLDEFRERDARAEAFPLREKLLSWMWSDWDALRALRPTMPEGVRDRPAEVWEALLAIADFAGGDWPKRAREACRYFVLDTEPDERLSLGVRLLRDIKAALGEQDRMFSADLVTALTSDQESEWRDLWGKPLDQRRLAKELKRYGIESQEVRIGAENRKGYVVPGDTGLAQAWHRYLVSGPKRDKGDKGDIAGQSVADVSRIDPERDKRDTSATPETPSEQRLSDSVADVADVAHIDGRDAASAAYLNGQCRDCRKRPHSAGRPRCDECHRAWLITVDGYDR